VFLKICFQFKVIVKSRVVSNLVLHFETMAFFIKLSSDVLQPLLKLVKKIKVENV